MLRVMRMAVLLAGCSGMLPAAAIAQESKAEPQQESIAKPAEAEPADQQPTRSDSVSLGYYANYPARGYYAPYVYWPNYPPKYPALLGYGYGIRGELLYHPRYIFGHPSGYLHEHCPNDHKYGPVYYRSGMPVSGSQVEWRHYTNGGTVINSVPARW